VEWPFAVFWRTLAGHSFSLASLAILFIVHPTDGDPTASRIDRTLAFKQFWYRGRSS
jgi:hypothetical protein